MRKVTVEVKVKIDISMDEGIEVSEVINEMAYDFTSGTSKADFLDTEILNFEIKDSR